MLTRQAVVTIHPTILVGASFEILVWPYSYLAFLLWHILCLAFQKRVLSYFVSQIRACCVSHVSHSVSQNEGLLRRVGWTRDKRQATATASGKLPHTRPSICISLYLCPTPTPGWQATMFVYVTCACISACKFIRLYVQNGLYGVRHT